MKDLKAKTYEILEIMAARAKCVWFFNIAVIKFNAISLGVCLKVLEDSIFDNFDKQALRRSLVRDHTNRIA